MSAQLQENFRHILYKSGFYLSSAGNMIPTLQLPNTGALSL